MKRRERKRAAQELAVLRVLASLPYAMTGWEVQQEVGWSWASATYRTLDRLEAAGEVRSVVHPGDKGGRVVYQLTGLGHARLAVEEGP
jgi:DNA-binding PadR family transcriptional regulator